MNKSKYTLIIPKPGRIILNLSDYEAATLDNHLVTYIASNDKQLPIKFIEILNKISSSIRKQFPESKPTGYDNLLQKYGVEENDD
jgi:hypothetical protein